MVGWVESGAVGAGGGWGGGWAGGWDGSILAVLKVLKALQALQPAEEDPQPPADPADGDQSDQVGEEAAQVASQVGEEAAAATLAEAPAAAATLAEDSGAASAEMEDGQADPEDAEVQRTGEELALAEGNSTVSSGSPAPAGLVTTRFAEASQGPPASAEPELDASVIAALKTPKERNFLLKLESHIVSNLQSDKIERIKLTTPIPPKLRFLVHLLADYFGLHRIVDQKPGEPQKATMTLLRTPNTRIPALSLAAICDELDGKERPVMHLQQKDEGLAAGGPLPVRPLTPSGSQVLAGPPSSSDANQHKPLSWAAMASKSTPLVGRPRAGPRNLGPRMLKKDGVGSLPSVEEGAAEEGAEQTEEGGPLEEEGAPLDGLEAAVEASEAEGPGGPTPSPEESPGDEAEDGEEEDGEDDETQSEDEDDELISRPAAQPVMIPGQFKLLPRRQVEKVPKGSGDEAESLCMLTSISIVRARIFAESAASDASIQEGFGPAQAGYLNSMFYQMIVGWPRASLLGDASVSVSFLFLCALIASICSRRLEVFAAMFWACSSLAAALRVGAEFQKPQA
ncbi:unnamed protein product [Polarella glacialis]|uniref:R3H domain-containing protein n=1 Tax=Polarella glacialis TaxID=89957 RepID=A0A813KXL9_POLGL|nr:unnamed protein product [Polarella glacialis]